MKKILICILLFAAAISIFYIFNPLNSGFLTGKYTSIVSRVIDGDTVELQTGEHVRLLGINTPERGQHLFVESTNFLKNLVENKTVVLESDIEDKDKYGRLLRHIHIGDVFVNIELVKLGYATAYIIPPDEKYKDIIIEAEREAKDKEIGIWKIKIKDAFCIGIYEFHYNAMGDDNENLNDEYVVLRNSCNYTINMGGWRLMDATNNTYVFPNFSPAGKEKFRLNSGSGINNETDLHWGRTRAVWNNNGDRLLLYDADNNLMLDYKY